MTSELISLANKLEEKYAGERHESITLTRETSQAELTSWARQNPTLAEELRRMLNEILGPRVPQNYGEMETLQESTPEQEVETIDTKNPEFWSLLSRRAVELGGVHRGGINRSSYLFPTEESAKKFVRLLHNIGFPSNGDPKEEKGDPVKGSKGGWRVAAP